MAELDISTTCFGQTRPSPFYLSSVAKGGLVSAENKEVAFVRAAHQHGVPYIVPTVSTESHEQIFASAMPGQGLPYQFYLLGDNEGSIRKLQVPKHSNFFCNLVFCGKLHEIVDSFRFFILGFWISLVLFLLCAHCLQKEAIRLGCSSVVVTVDNNAPRKGSLLKATTITSNVFPDPSFSWAQMDKIRSIVPSDIPLFLKGVQTAEDALEAVKFGVQGIIVSNHGGRACGGCRSSFASLEEITCCFRSKGLLGKIEILFDGGVRTGRDAFKALCMGASAIGLGRPYYWASAGYGEAGIIRLLRMLDEELLHTMAQAGSPTLKMLNPSSLCRRCTPYSPLAFVDHKFNTEFACLSRSKL